MGSPIIETKYYKYLREDGYFISNQSGTVEVNLLPL